MNRDLTKFGLLKISGPGAKQFLQGQLTCDMEKITPESFSLAAHCNPQGRVISLFYLFSHLNQYYLLMQRGMVAVTISALKKYAIFFKIELTDASEELSAVAALANQCYQQMIAKGIPLIYPETSGMFLPHELNLQDLNAIDFNKGCYTGQEVIARMHYRGKIKNRLYCYKLPQATLPAPGADIYTQADFRVCGTVVDSRQENNAHYAFIIMNEANVHDNDFFLKDNIPVTLQLANDA